MRDALDVVLVDVRLEKPLLHKMLQPLVGKVDAELIEGVGPAGHVLRAGEIEKADKGGEIVLAEALVDVLVQPRKEEGVERFGEIIPVIRGAIRIEEDRAQLLFDQFGFVGQRGLEGRRRHAQKVGDDLKNVRVPDDRGILVPVPVDDELEVAEVEDGGDELAGLGDVALGHADGLEGDLELVEAEGVVVAGSLLSAPRRHASRAALAEIAVRRLVEQMEMLALLRGRAGDEIVEDVEVALARGHGGDPVALEVVVEGLDAAEAAAVGELELGVLAEAGGVGVEEGAGVAEGLDDELGGRDLRRELGALLAGVGDAELEERLDGEASVLGLAAARLAAGKKCEPGSG